MSYFEMFRKAKREGIEALELLCATSAKEVFEMWEEDENNEELFNRVADVIYYQIVDKDRPLSDVEEDLYYLKENGDYKTLEDAIENL